MKLQLTTETKSHFSNETTLGFCYLTKKKINKNALNSSSLIVPHFISFGPIPTSLCEERFYICASVKNTSRC